MATMFFWWRDEWTGFSRWPFQFAPVHRPVRAGQTIEMSKQPPAMSAADVVAASLTALAQDEIVCIPGLADPKLWVGLNDAHLAVFRGAAMQATSAERYRLQPA
jgi:hypothetical protein